MATLSQTKSTQYNRNVYLQWLRKKADVIVEDVIKQVLRTQKPWSDWIREDPIYTFHPKTLKAVQKWLTTVGIPDKERDFYKFLMSKGEFLKTAIWNEVIRDPFLLKYYVLYNAYGDDSLYSRLWFRYGDYWLTGENLQEVVAQWTRIDRIFSILSITESKHGQFGIKEGDKIYPVSILPLKKPMIVVLSEQLPTLVPIENVKWGTLAQKKEEGESYYRDSNFNLFLDKDMSGVMWKDGRELKPVKIKDLRAEGPS